MVGGGGRCGVLARRLQRALSLSLSPFNVCVLTLFSPHLSRNAGRQWLPDGVEQALRL
jgi:hypothetical protein